MELAQVVTITATHDEELFTNMSCMLTLSASKMKNKTVSITVINIDDGGDGTVTIDNYTWKLGSFNTTGVELASSTQCITDSIPINNNKSYKLEINAVTDLRYYFYTADNIFISIDGAEIGRAS